MHRRTPFLLGFLLLLAPVSSTVAETIDFAREVRPILERSCFRCHGQEKQKSGYRLDRRRDAFKGGDSGEAAIVPHHSATSPLLRFISGEDEEMQMPPKKSDAPPLSSGEVATLRTWIDAGAPWPDSLAGESAEEVRKHWAWQSLVQPPLPSSPHENPIDVFLEARLTEKGVVPAPEADRRTLIRRLFFDLHGLAPTPEEADTFATDPDSRAYEKLVDRLLASPRYGERWARHWFDAIHFADTHGFEHDRIREHAWRYRDYVIAALNADTPWPRFVREQLAADVLFPESPQLTPALGFLGAGPFDQSAAETAPKMFEAADRDDLLVQTMAVFTSTTTGCARCHDHKFDPIPQRDYYALAAVFAGVTKGDVSFDKTAGVRAERQHWTQLATAAEKRDCTVLLSAEGQQIARTWEAEPGAPVEWEILAPDEITSAGGATIEQRDDGAFVSKGARPDKETVTLSVKTRAQRIAALRLELLPDDSLPHRGPGRQDNGNVHTSEVELHVVENGNSHPLAFRRAVADFDQAGLPIANAIDGNEKTDWGIYPRVGEAHVGVFELAQPLVLAEGAHLRVALHHRYGQGHVLGCFRIAITGDAPERALPLPNTVEAALRIPAAERDAATQMVIAAHAVQLRATTELAKLPALSVVYAAGAEVSRLSKKVTIPEPRKIHLLRRGDLAQPQEEVAPGALSCIAALPSRFTLAAPNNEAARRAALAEWIADPQNPLTWRSIVNRVWHHHFGRGLVDTPNDFGRMGGKPSHPELLDWLAVEFQKHDGSLNWLHRLIVCSDAYRRATAGTTPGDAENTLLAHRQPQRLDAESFRDIVLQCAGQLDLSMGGPSVMHFKLGPPIQETPTLDYAAHDWDAPGSSRRSIYRLVYRNIADPFMAALDFPDAAQLAPKRAASSSALQALALWNDAFVLRQCEHLATRAELISADPSRQVRAVVRLTLLREPTATELCEFSQLVRKAGLAALCRVLFNSNEFLFVE